jgi:transposase
MTHDYKRHGTTTLFAALDVLAGKVIGDCYKRHRHQEFLRFLRRINREFPGKVPLHLVMDNYGTHGTPEVKDWLNRHPRFRVHYVPTSSSWLNLIERPRLLRHHRNGQRGRGWQYVVRRVDATGLPLPAALSRAYRGTMT